VPKQPIVIIGAGVGGLSAAALLAARGESVLVLERAATPGGKMRQVKIGEAAIDGGPTVFTMRWVFDDIFAAAGSRLEDHLALARLDILARHAWGPSQRLDLFADVQRSADAVASFSGAEEGRRFLGFCAESRRIYDTLRKPFLMSQRPDPVKLATANGLGGMTGMLRINPFEKMWTALGRHFTDPRLRQLFGRYATYCGSSPFSAPATLMLVAHVERTGAIGMIAIGGWEKFKGGSRVEFLCGGRARHQHGQRSSRYPLQHARLSFFDRFQGSSRSSPRCRRRAAPCSARRLRSAAEYSRRPASQRPNGESVEIGAQVRPSVRQSTLAGLRQAGPGTKSRTNVAPGAGRLRSQ